MKKIINQLEINIEKRINEFTQTMKKDDRIGVLENILKYLN